MRPAADGAGRGQRSGGGWIFFRHSPRQRSPGRRIPAVCRGGKRLRLETLAPAVIRPERQRAGALNTCGPYAGIDGNFSPGFLFDPCKRLSVNDFFPVLVRYALLWNVVRVSVGVLKSESRIDLLPAELHVNTVITHPVLAGTPGISDLTAMRYMTMLMGPSA